MDAFELLKADHKKVAELFDLLESATGKRKLAVFRQIKSELEVHTHIEETIFYPALEKPEETHDLTLEAYEEHKVVKTLLAELAGAKSANDEWQAKAKVLRENVEHHVKEEENELFNKADDALNDEEVEALGERMTAEKARKQGQPGLKLSAKSSGSRAKSSDEKSAEKPGIISKLANFIGLGSDNSKKAVKRAPAKKKQGSAKRSTKSSQRVGTTASKRSSSSVAPKRVSGSKSAAPRKRGAARPAKRPSKKSASRQSGRK